MNNELIMHSLFMQSKMYWKTNGVSRRVFTRLICRPMSPNRRKSTFLAEIFRFATKRNLKKFLLVANRRRTCWPGRSIVRQKHRSHDTLIGANTRSPPSRDGTRDRRTEVVYDTSWANHPVIQTEPRCEVCINNWRQKIGFRQKLTSGRETSPIDSDFRAESIRACFRVGRELFAEPDFLAPRVYHPKTIGRHTLSATQSNPMDFTIGRIRLLVAHHLTLAN